jgi:hypothetical protein
MKSLLLFVGFSAFADGFKAYQFTHEWLKTAHQS